ncbi:MAG: hypothetical protein K9W42_03860 [Candidatus Heimdallarchaeota archaeon]|nr:hypothetical protein [Candidatus Heimdallarchaeota archaeon]
MKTKRSLILFVILLTILSLNSFFVNSAYVDNIRIHFNGSGLYGDSVLILLVDVPSTGGKATRYFAYETTGKDDFDIYETLSGPDLAFMPYLNYMDFLIIVASNSNGGGWNDFSMQITVYDGSHSDKSYKYNFGDSAGDDLKVGIWQFTQYATMEFYNNGYTIASWRWDNQYAYWTDGGYSHDDWASFWSHLDDYFSSGADNEIEDVLAYVTFPDPWPP